MNKDCMYSRVVFYLSACVGGAFGAYAVLRFGMFASAQTMNLITIIFSVLGRNLEEFLVRMVIMLAYAAGAASGVLIPRYTKLDTRLFSTGVTMLCAVALCFVSETNGSELVLLPIFFAMSVQWNAFHGACGFDSTGIFMTNNFRQMVIGGVEYLCGRERQSLHKFWFYFGCLASYFAGCAVSFLLIRAYGFRTIVFAAIPAAVMHIMVIRLKKRCDCAA
ncbi:MAG: DUF1275 domain-containing protein [Oscillospiraceae bacterium]|nr:DUF1275 domain-containing protein [Oscillospiraceae bacterium]